MKKQEMMQADLFLVKPEALSSSWLVGAHGLLWLQ